MHAKRILFPTDLSPGAEPAKKLALALAKKHGAELLFFHAVVTHEHEFRQLGELLSDFLKNLESEASARLGEQASRLKSEGHVVHCVVEQRPCAYEAIMEQVSAWQPDLIVMGTHARDGMGRWFLGSVAEKIVRHAPTPVITVRAGDDARNPERIERVLVPVDFSDHSRRAVAAGQSLVRGEESLVLLHVVPNPTLRGLHPERHLRLFDSDPSLPERIVIEWASGWRARTSSRKSGSRTKSPNASSSWQTSTTSISSLWGPAA